MAVPDVAWTCLSDADVARIDDALEGTDLLPEQRRTLAARAAYSAVVCAEDQERED